MKNMAKEIVKVENKEHGKASAAASLAGALLGALALLADYIDTEDSSVRIGAIMGLGHAYAGAQNEQIRSKLTPILGDNKVPLDVIAFTAISLALVYVGSCNEEVAQAIIFALMDRSESELGEPLTRLLPLGLGLLYLGKQATTEVSKTFNEKIRKYYDMTLLSCAYAGTGNVLKKGETHQGPAILGITMVAMAEELGLEMAIRSLEHLLQYGEQNIRRAVPLALGLLCISNPKVNVMDTLNRLSHDTDTEVAMAGVISLGLIGAGTNNARIAGMLRNLSSYYYKEASLLFCVLIAQGLVHLGKGLLTLAPYHSERFLLSPDEQVSTMGDFFQSGSFHIRTDPLIGMFLLNLKIQPRTALAGIVTLLHACLDMKAIILGKYHYVLYFLVLAMQPRMLLTVDENLKPLLVPVRVGQAVNVVGQAGRPKTITGFQTHSTPVLLAAGDRAELATEKSTPLKLDLLPTEARISGKEYKERVVNNLKILIVHYSDGGGRRSRFLILFTVHQSHSKAVKRAISKHCGLNIQASDKENLELPIFDMVTISRATNIFCCTYKIGDSGFGSIYKGVLSTGKEVAVKRFSSNSKQGLNEFKNEVILIAKLQHRNLVRLLGCCIRGEERTLIYKYMPNGSLDSCIFGVVGTYGYMSPEYAIGGLFSTKSNVFSFGVIALEILSAKGIGCSIIQTTILTFLDM
ncbi:unnamed protein product [Camellia sinensis]